MIKLKGFTPLLDSIITEHGLTRAAIFGAVWRYCQQTPKRQCTASTEKIASRINVSTRTVIRHLEALCNDGYLKDLTPNLKHKPHTYLDTGKAFMELGMTESHTSEDNQEDQQSEGVTESHTRCDRESVKESIKKQKINTLSKDKVQPNGSDPAKTKEKPKPEKEKPKGPKTVIKDHFLEVTGLTFPGLKSEQKFWWSQLGELHRIFKQELDPALIGITSVVKYMQKENLSISCPKSIVGLCRSYAAGQLKGSTNGTIRHSQLDPTNPDDWEQLLKA